MLNQMICLSFSTVVIILHNAIVNSITFHIVEISWSVESLCDGVDLLI